MPRGGNSFQIISSLGTPITGTFDTDTDDLPTLTGDLSWQIDYSNPDFVFLRVHTPYTADFDGDGDVDGDDLNAHTDSWQSRFGNDLSGGNFLDWQRQFGSGVGAVSSSLRAGTETTAIPEPGVWSLFFSGFIALACLR